MTLILSGTAGLSDVDGSAATPAIRGTDTNTGIFFPAADTIAFAEGGVEAMRLDSSGNLGLGVTPAVWWSPVKALQVGSTGSLWNYNSGTKFANNYYANSSGGDTYLTTNYATMYEQITGKHIWYNAASGTAGNAITFTQAMTLNASGNLGVNISSPLAKLDIRGDTTTYATMAKIYLTDSNANAASRNWSIGNGGTGFGNLTFSVSAAKDGNAGDATSLPRMVIDGSGNLLVGTTSSVGRVAVQVATNGDPGVYFRNSSGTNVGQIQVQSASTVYVTSSDYRLKHDIQPMTGALAKVAALKPVTYKWNVDNSDSQGFIAHELQAIVPECVVGEKDAVDADGNPQYQGIDTSFLVATLTAALQEMKAIIDDQAARIAALEAK